MKTISLFLLLFTFVSCETVLQVPKYVSVSSFIDYSYFTDKGIYVSESNSVNFDYTPMGSIDILIASGYKFKQGVVKEKDMLGQTFYSDSKSEWKNATINEAFDELYKVAINKNANGIINLKISQNIVESYDRKNSGLSFHITGMAIRK
jgi:uncharacterized protein YbjQ (UPF0145 family)